MRAIDYLLKRKEELGISYEEMAQKAGMSPAAWYVLIKRGKVPTLTRAKQLTQILDMNEPDNFINLVFRDRLVEYLEKEANKNKHLTPQIRKIIRSIKSWRPDRGESIGYIMLTLLDSGSDDGTGIAAKDNDSPLLRSIVCQKCLTPVVTDGISEQDLR